MVCAVGLVHMQANDLDVAVVFCFFLFVFFGFVFLGVNVNNGVCAGLCNRMKTKTRRNGSACD